MTIITTFKVPQNNVTDSALQLSDLISFLGMHNSHKKIGYVIDTEFEMKNSRKSLSMSLSSDKNNYNTTTHLKFHRKQEKYDCSMLSKSSDSISPRGSMLAISEHNQV